MIKFTATKGESDLIQEIAGRAMIVAARARDTYPMMDALMDIEACHSNGCPLDLDRLLAADAGNFAHDVFGIRRHLDRETGKLTQCFVPRFAK